MLFERPASVKNPTHMLPIEAEHRPSQATHNFFATGREETACSSDIRPDILYDLPQLMYLQTWLVLTVESDHWF